MPEERDFKGIWIPKEIWLDTRLNALDKIILMDIDSLDRTERGCFASNQYLAEFCQCSETKVSKAISKLVDLGYIYVKSFDGRRRELKSSLTFFTNQPCKKSEADLENLQESNNMEIKTVNKTDKSKRAKMNPIEDFTSNIELRIALYDFIEMRKTIKKPMTEKAIEILIRKLKSLSRDEDEQIAILNQSIEHSWQSVYPLKEKPKTENPDFEGIL